MKLRDAHALVTGGAVRLGRAVALALSRQGCRLTVHYGRSADAAEDLVGKIRAQGGTANAVAADLVEAEACLALMDSAAAQAGPVQILVNSAAIFPPGGLFDTTVESFDRQLALNLRAPFLLARELARALPADDQGGIVNIVDARYRRPGPDHLAYRLAKVGLAQLTEILALELAPAISVNGVAPGAMLPPPGQDPGGLAKHALRRIPLQRPGGSEPIADAVVFLLSQEFVTGQILSVDGGEFL